MVKDNLEDGANDFAKIDSINELLFKKLGFHGSRADYYHKANSYIDRVIDDREGLPITLSILYISIANRVGVEIEGVGLPGHFVVREPRTHRMIDVFDAGKTLTEIDIGQIVRGATGRRITAEDRKTSSSREIVVRMLRNLLGLAERDQDFESMLRYVEVMSTIEPAEPIHSGHASSTSFSSRTLSGSIRRSQLVYRKQARRHRSRAIEATRRIHQEDSCQSEW